MATRQLTGFSGSDLYINLNSENSIIQLYNAIMDNTVTSVNGRDTRKDTQSEQVFFTIHESMSNEYYEIHIKKQTDGYWFRLTPYIKKNLTLPGEFFVIDIKFDNTNCNLNIRKEELYKYILHRHPRVKERYKIMSDNPPNNRQTITTETEQYLSNYSILPTHDNSLKWGRDHSYSYTASNYSKKYIGVPYDSSLPCDEFDDIGEII